ncbi:STAS domain-containing protein [Streptomyces roseoverticillatus]|uniref:Anti-sigma factor antagonist n=1 Tax=Streptomyces roseoverticillatus TaxID=66429 RepID=A0ABV3J602_9ACTN
MRFAPRRRVVPVERGTVPAPAAVPRGAGGRVSASRCHSPPSGSPRDRVLVVRGRLDLSGVARLRERLLHVSHSPGSRLILDLSGVTSCDALGLGLLVAAARGARHSGGDLCLVAPRPAVAQALKASGLGRILPAFPGFDGRSGAGTGNGPAPRPGDHGQKSGRISGRTESPGSLREEHPPEAV